MRFPMRAKITVLIIAGLGVGTGGLVLGLLLPERGPDSPATFIAGGSAILAASVSAFVAHLAGAFKEIENDD